MVTIELRTREDEPRPALLLQGLIKSGKLPNFMARFEHSDSAWLSLCFLEDDALAFLGKNRWCGSTDGWYIEVGTCPVLPQVPDYNDWGHVAAWLVYEDYVVVLDPPGERIVVWDAEDFYEVNEATVRTTTPFADDSAIFLNKILKAYARQEGGHHA